LVFGARQYIKIPANSIAFAVFLAALGNARAMTCSSGRAASGIAARVAGGLLPLRGTLFVRVIRFASVVAPGVEGSRLKRASSPNSLICNISDKYGDMEEIAI